MSPATGSGQRCVASRKRAIAWNGQSLCAATSAAPPPTRVPGASNGASSSRTVSRSLPEPGAVPPSGGTGSSARVSPGGTSNDARANVIVDVRRERKDHVLRAARPLRGQRFGVRELPRRSCVRRVAFALPCERKQRVGSRRRRPGVGGEPGDPQGVERKPRRFEPAEDLHGSARRLRLKDVLACECSERCHCVVRRDALSDPAERRKLGKQLVPHASRLPFRRRKRPVPGPSHRLDPRTPECGPLTRARAGRPAQPLARLSPALRKRLIDAGKRGDRVIDCGIAPPFLEPVAFELRPAQPIAGRCCQIRRAQQRGGTPHRERTVCERDQVDRRREQRHRARRGTERQVVRPRRLLVARPLQRGTEYLVGERAYFLASRPEILHRDADRRAGIGQHAVACPPQRAHHLVARGRRRDPPHRAGHIAGRLAMRDGHPGSRERTDEPLLLWRRLDESREAHRGAAPRGDASCVVREPVGKLPEIDARSRRPSWPRTDRPSERTLAGRRRRRSIRASSRRPRPTHERATMRRPRASRARLRRSAADDRRRQCASTGMCSARA